jgi:hypothetical protein
MPLKAPGRPQKSAGHPPMISGSEIGVRDGALVVVPAYCRFPDGVWITAPTRTRRSGQSNKKLQLSEGGELLGGFAASDVTALLSSAHV